MTAQVKRETEIKKNDGVKRFPTETRNPKSKDKTQPKMGIVSKASESIPSRFDKILASDSNDQFSDSRMTSGKNAIQHMSEQTMDSKMKLSELTKD